MTTKDASPFLKFWEIYPRRVGKGAARRAWLKACKLAAPEAIIEALRAQVNACVFGAEATFIPYPATWLNSERWDDELPGPARGPVADLGRQWLAACRGGNDGAKRRVLAAARDGGIAAADVYAAAAIQETEA